MSKGRFTLMALAWVVVLAGCAGEPAAETAEPVAQPEPTVGTESAAPDPSGLVRNGMMPFEGLLTGGQPTDEQLVALRDLGYQTVINLRQPDEKGVAGEPERVAELGMTYLSIPVAGEAGLTEENAAALAAALDEAAQPVLLHCGSGNRVGALLALKAFKIDGATAEEAMEIGLAGGVTRLEPAVRKLLGLTE